MASIDNLISKGTKFYDQILANENARFKSWEHCYKSFQEAYYKGKMDEQMIDYLSLQLSFYLASWGMYRGSSFLLEFDYKVHRKVVEYLFKPEYEILWKMRIDSDRNQDLSNFYNMLMKLIKEIKGYYKKKREIVKDISCHSKISDTLVSKVLLGTIGCVPAYDRFFIFGITNMNVSTRTLNDKSIKKLIEYYKDNYTQFEKLRNKMSTKDLEYSQMKVLDSCFWQFGYDTKKAGIKS